MSSPARAQWAPAAVISDVEPSPQVCNHIRHIVALQVARDHNKQSQQATQQSLGNVLLNMFFNWLY